MEQTFDLSKMGLVPMITAEMQVVDGGEWPGWLKGIGIAGVASEIIEHWDEIKQGFKDGWNAVN
jgi:hypothetical protein